MGLHSFQLMNTNRSADRLIMDRTNKILIDLRAKPKTGIHRYASCLLNQQDFYSAPYQDSFSDYRTPGRITPLSAIQRFLYECIFLPFLLKKQKIALFHCTKNFGLPLFSFGTKRVLTVQDLIPLHLPEYAPNRLIRIYYYWNILLSCAAADHILCISQFTANELTRLFPFVRKKLTITYLGVDSEYFAQSPTDEKDLPPGLKGKYILTIGGTEPRKNTKIVMDLFLQHPFEGYQLVVIGSEWNGRQFTPTEKSSPWILRPGKVTEKQLLALYQHASLFIFPSVYEGFGLPPLEAMACGVPVAAAKASCLPEILGDAAEWFEPHSQDSLISAVHQILHNHDHRNNLIQKGYRKAKTYTWEKTVRETLNVYHILLKNPSG